MSRPLMRQHLRTPPKSSRITASVLRDYLFSKHTLPTWGDDPSNLEIGPEQEWLLRRKDGALTPFGKKEFELLINKLIHFHLFHANNTPAEKGQISASLETDSGYIKIKPDFTFGILEISFHPIRTPQAFTKLFNAIVPHIDRYLGELGYGRATVSAWENPNRPFELVNIPRLSGYLDQFLPIEQDKNVFYVPHYPALIASTQVHLNILDSNVFSSLRPMYELEWLAIKTFSRSRIFAGKPVGCARVLLYEASLGEAYRLKTVPEPIPSNIEEYANLFNSSAHYFTNDPFFPVRDLSFLRPRPFGTIEFRSACSQPDANGILAVCAFRIFQALYGLRYRNRPIDSKSGWEKKSVLIASGMNPGALHTLSQTTETLSRAKEIIHQVPEAWRPFLPKDVTGVGYEPFY